MEDKQVCKICPTTGFSPLLTVHLPNRIINSDKWTTKVSLLWNVFSEGKGDMLVTK